MGGGGWYAQHGEDRILSAVLPERPGVFVEVGAADGVEGSNTLHFEQIGWTGVLVEANPHFAEQCRRARSTIVAECAVTAPGGPRLLPFQVVPQIPQLSGLRPNIETLRRHGIDRLETVEVPCRTLDDVLDESLAGQSIDFVTIDVEGHEWEVLQGFSLDLWTPTIVLIERNFYPNWRVLRHMHNHGYAFTRTTGVNDWFERDVPQTRRELIEAAVPHYRDNLRPLVRSILESAGVLDPVMRRYEKLRSRIGSR